MTTSGARVETGTWAPGMRYLRTGPRDDAQPLLVLPGLESHAQPPTGLGRRMVLGSLRPLAGARDVWWVDRRTGLRPGVTIADLAADYADGIARRHDGPVDVVGTSTGGSIALQLAADHPRLVRRLVLVSISSTLASASVAWPWVSCQRGLSGMCRRM